MKNNYYFKSILRVIKKNPIQPILITFIFILAFIVSNISLTLSKAFSDNEQGELQSKYGMSEIAISSNSKSGSRFIFEDDILEVLPESTVTGSFAVPFTRNEDLVNSIAVNYETINNLFDFNFISYQSFNINNKEEVIFVSKRYALENNLSVGDNLTLTLFGKDEEYQIFGISDIPFLGENDILCDTSAIISSLAAASSYLSLFIDDFNLYGTVYVKSNGNLDEAITKLKETYPNYTVEQVSRDMKSNRQSISEAISIVMVFLCVVTTFAVILTSTYSLTKQRKELCDLFNYAGLSKKRLTTYKIVEMLIYSLIGFVVGTSLSVLIGKLSYKIIGFIYTSYEFNLLYAIFNLIVLVLCAIIPPIIYEYRSEKKKQNKISKWFLLMPVTAFILFIITYIIRGQYKFTIAMIVMPLAFLSIAIFFDPLIKIIAKWFAEKEHDPIKKIAFKNCYKIGEIANVAKLLVILASIIFVALVFTLTSIADKKVSEGFLKGDYAISGGNTEVASKVNDLDSVANVTGFYSSSLYLTKNKYVYVFASSSLDCFDELCLFKTLPQGNEIITSKGYAARYGYKKGDKIKISYNGKEKDFVIKETTNGGECFFLADINYLEESYNFYFVNGKSDISKGDLYADITSITATEMLTVIEPIDIISYFVNSQIVYIYFCLLMVVIIFVFGTIGVYNNLSEGMRARRIEFEYYSLCGMSKKNIKKMLKTEVLFSIILMIVLTVTIGTALVLESCEGMLSFGASPLDLLRLMFFGK